MKIALFVLCFFCATTALAQSAVGGASLSAEPVVVEFHSHEGHASFQAMGQEQNLFAQSTNIQAHGVRPLWEVALPSHVTPLGDSARLLKKEHDAAKKAEIVWSN